MDGKWKVVFGMEGLKEFREAAYHVSASLASLARIVLAFYSLSSKEAYPKKVS